ncbi:MAG: 1-acyl-sn-glycerol-3-phosphate acyltransferase [Fimbriimonadaceae bacterium]|nr:1-acyl-sn-glycerol-3-phosphate acyltransferase [Fimbriimonadaceae bacterium]
MSETTYPLRHHWTVRLAIPFLRLTVGALLYWLGRPRISGKHLIPPRGGVLIIANHLSDVDPILIQLACPRPIHFMAKNSLFRMKRIGKFMKWFGAFPVKPGSADRGALERAIALLQAGEVVCMFPEGGINVTADPVLPLKSGFVRVARDGNAMILPMRITNTNRIRTSDADRTHRSPVPITGTWKEARRPPHESEEEVVKWATEMLSN